MKRLVFKTNTVRAALRTAASLALFSFCIAAPCFSAQTSATTPAPAYKEVVDELGRTIRVPQSINRIVSLAPSLTETLYALGVQDRLVGDTDYCDYPADAQKKIKVGGAINPSLEQIVALRPDLVLVTKSLNRLETVHALADLGIPSYATDPHSVQQIVSSTERLAGLLGASEAGVSLATDLDRRLTDLRQKLAAYPSRSVLFVVWTEPLISIGQNTFIADAVRQAGATSIVDSSQDWPQISLEEVVRLQPDYLVFAASHADAAQSDFEALAERPGWRGLDAVRNRHVAIISDAVNRPAPRLVSAIEDLARQIHPEAFSAHPPDEADKSVSPSAVQARPVSIVGLQLPQLATAQQEVCACAR